MVTNGRYSVKSHTHFDVADVKAMAAGRWVEIFVHLAGIAPDLLDGRHHPCPRCGGKDRFRHIDATAGGVFCNQCFSKGNGDGLATLMWLCGWNFRQALQAAAAYLGIGDGRPAPRPNTPPTRRDSQPTKPAPKIDRSSRFEAFFRTLRANAKVLGSEVLDQHAAALGLSLASLEAFGAVTAGTHLFVPEYDGTGGIVGHQRRSLTGTKRNEGARGLGLGIGWLERATRTGVLYVTEGSSDAMALWAMGLAAVSRSSKASCAAELSTLLGTLPPSVQIVVVADRDPDGGGQAGARSVAAEIGERTSRVIQVVLPPTGYKDCRSWFVDQQVDLLDELALLAAGWAFSSGMVPIQRETDQGRAGTRADNSSHLGDNSATTLANGAVCPSYPEEELPLPNWDTGGWCPSSLDVSAGVAHGSGVASVPCGKRFCPVCLARWKDRTYRKLAAHVQAHGGPLHSAVVDVSDWPAVVKGMRRVAARAGTPLDYVAVLDASGDGLVVLSTVSIGLGDAQIDWLQPPLRACADSAHCPG